MQTVAIILALATVACAQYAYGPASYLTRAPQFDSAVIKSDRLGGNFAYSVAESHAYAQHTPIVQHVQTPVAVSYSAPAVQYAAAPHYAQAAHPIAYNAGYGHAYPAYAGHGYGYGAYGLLKK